MILVYPEYKVIFMTHKKCGETNLTRALGVDWPRIKERGVLGMPSNKGDTINKLSYFKKQFPDYYTASFVRNPWNRMVSAYYYQIQHSNMNKNITFENFLEKNPTAKIESFTYFIDCNIDFIGKMENFIEDFNKFCDIVGAKIDTENHPLDRNRFKNKSKRPHKNYRKFYNDKTKKIVGEMFKEDIKKFNYKF